MLQIASGKLFRQGVFRTNRLRGVLYSNLDVLETAATVAGTLLPVDSLREGHSLVFEFDERVEGDPSVLVPGLATSYGIDQYLYDFAALVSFYLEVVCSPDLDLVRRLTSGKRGLATRSPPNQLLKRVFDAEVRVLPPQAARLSDFVVQLIGLRRNTFLEVMRAIRTYVTGLHRMGDDLEMGYTRMVASIESLSQAFDPLETSWKDYESAKRHRVDTALAGVDDAAAARVRAAVLENEHVALRRKFKAFAQENLPANFYRDQAGRVLPIGRQDLADGLDVAYAIRSSHLHRLTALPQELSDDRGFAETRTVEHKTALTFQGMARVARAAILEFVARQVAVEREPYDYTLEIPNISRGHWSPQIWMNNLAAVHEDNARAWLEGFLEQVSAYLLSPTSAQFSDLRGALANLPALLPQFKPKARLPYLTAYFAYNLLFPPDMRHAEWEAMNKQYHACFDAPSPESLVVHCLISQVPSWGLAVHAEALDKHLARHSHDNGYRFPRLFDVAMSLDLMERYRVAGEIDEVRRRLSLAVESFPAIVQLAELEASFEPATVIAWRQLLLPQTVQPAAAASTPEPEVAEVEIERQALLCRLVSALRQRLSRNN